jgi:hypothetical protein
MKKLYFFIAILFMAGLCKLQAQADIPKGFSKGTVTLSDGTIIAGYIKENIRSNASVAIITDAGKKKKNYNANELQSAEIDSSRFVCIKGDFFRIVCAGELCLLQKSSNAAGNAVYNGTEAMFIEGTEGKVNDYFFYDHAQHQLKLLTKKNREEIIAGTFTNCAAAIAKAKESDTDMAMLRQAVEIYNNRNGK